MTHYMIDSWVGPAREITKEEFEAFQARPRVALPGPYVPEYPEYIDHEGDVDRQHYLKQDG